MKTTEAAVIANDLLRRAGRLAAAEVEGQEVPAGAFAERIRRHLVAQARIGMWVPVGIRNEMEMGGVRIRARKGTGEEPPVVIEYDFSRTPAKMLRAEGAPQKIEPEAV
jgi:hypothetical protein